MLTLLAVLGVLVVLFVAAAVATSDRRLLADAPADVADVDLPTGPLEPSDVRRVRFGLALRGYRMSEVDEVLERLAVELADRDRALAAARSGLSPDAMRDAGPSVTADSTADRRADLRADVTVHDR